MRRALAIAVLAYALVVALILGLALTHHALLAAAAPAPGVPAERARVLVVWQGYDGPVETAGDVLAWRYGAPLMRLDYGDLGADGIRRSGFETLPPAPCIGGAR